MSATEVSFVLDDRLSWAEAQALCSEHAERLVGCVWFEARCPFCGSLEIGSHTFSVSDVEAFLVEAWARQRQEPSRALARRYWVRRSPFYSRRSRYDALMAALVDIGSVIDRGARSAGILVVPPKTSLEMLERWCKLSGVSGVSG